MSGLEIFKGSKNFWRIRANVDFNIIEHTISGCIEVISFNPALYVEAPRLFLSIEKLSSKIEEEKIDDMISKRREEMTRKRQERVPTEELRRKVIRDLCAEYILARMQVSVHETSQAFGATFVPFTSDEMTEDELKTFVLTHPDSLQETRIERNGRLASTKEFNASLHALRSDARLLSQASSAAEQIISLEAKAIDGFRGLLTCSKYYSDTMTPTKRRWVRSIRRVIAQNHVAAFTKRLEEIEAKKIDTLAPIVSLGSSSKASANLNSSSKRSKADMKSGAVSSAVSGKDSRRVSKSFEGTHSGTTPAAAALASSRQIRESFPLQLPDIKTNSALSGQMIKSPSELIVSLKGTDGDGIVELPSQRALVKKGISSRRSSIKTYTLTPSKSVGSLPANRMLVNGWQESIDTIDASRGGVETTATTATTAADNIKITFMPPLRSPRIAAAAIAPPGLFQRESSSNC